MDEPTWEDYVNRLLRHQDEDLLRAREEALSASLDRLYRRRVDAAIEKWIREKDQEKKANA